MFKIRFKFDTIQLKTCDMTSLLEQPSEILITIIKHLNYTEAGRLCQTCKQLIRLETCVIKQLIAPFYYYENALLNLMLNPLRFRKLIEYDIKPDPSQIDVGKLVSKLTINQPTSLNYMLIYEKVFSNWNRLYGILNTICTQSHLPCCGPSSSYQFYRTGYLSSHIEMTVCEMLKRFILTDKLTPNEKRMLILNHANHSPKVLDFVILNSTLFDDDLCWIFTQNLPVFTFKEIFKVKKLDPLDIANLIVKLCTKAADFGSNRFDSEYILDLNLHDPKRIKGISGYSDIMLNDIINTGSFYESALYKAIKRGFIVVSPEMFNSKIQNFMDSPKLLVLLILKSQHVPSNFFIQIVSKLNSKQVEKLILSEPIRKQFGDLCYTNLTKIIEKRLFMLYKVMNLRNLDVGVLKDIVSVYPLAFKSLFPSQRDKLLHHLSPQEKKIIQDAFFTTCTALVPQICDQTATTRLLGLMVPRIQDNSKEYVFILESLKSVLSTNIQLSEVETIFRFVFKIHELCILKPDFKMVDQIRTALISKNERVFS